MVHLTVHLNREVKLYGIKDYVQSKINPEGCIVEKNVVEETIEFFIEFLKTCILLVFHMTSSNTFGTESGEDTNYLMDGTTLSTSKTVDFFGIVKYVVYYNTIQRNCSQHNKVERELAISKQKHTKIQNICYHGYTFRTKRHACKVHRDNRVSVVANVTFLVK
uniref:DUF4218 domain-containing protein n=1 Tax=Lactuca sativa TaxID=4236 RepID=A0A9R1UYF1_LACSA|nr:hypothetical protein LSAT_V11C700349360 [Lactuca sativa]